MHRYGGVPGISSVIRFFGNVFAWVSLLAGAFDGLENLALIQFLLGSELTFWNEPLEHSGQDWVAALGNGLAKADCDSPFL